MVMENCIVAVVIKKMVLWFKLLSRECVEEDEEAIE